MGIQRALAFLSLVGSLNACALPDAMPTPAPELLPLRTSFAKASPGFVAFCERSPGQCLGGGSSVPLAMNAETWETLEGVNTATNFAIAPKADRVHYGVDVYWTIPADGYGDCDDCVLAKRSALIARGITESDNGVGAAHRHRVHVSLRPPYGADRVHRQGHLCAQ
jgi:predicted transglutaminase-like cysteine proteinase